MQADFDPALVRLFDKYGQGAVAQSVVSTGEVIAVSINATSADAVQGALSSPFGFPDFMTDSGVVRVARAVSVAETVNGLDDQTAIVRVRQNGQDDLSVSFYRVDDLSGSINGIQAGQAGYAAAALARTYQFEGGGLAVNGPGYGNYTEARLTDVDSGDLIAMKLVNNSSGNTYWAFSQANESVNGQSVGHVWNYGLNTFGIEDTYGGGDRDFNDMTVQYDYTSAYGSSLLVRAKGAAVTLLMDIDRRRQIGHIGNRAQVSRRQVKPAWNKLDDRLGFSTPTCLYPRQRQTYADPRY
jgi:hypothetical protein